MEVTVTKAGNNPSLITKTTYRCSNQECQDECDKRTAKKEEIRKEQELARQNRAATNHKSITIKAPV